MHMAQREKIVMMWMGVFNVDRKFGDGICGMKMLNQNMREKNWKDQQKPQEEQQKPLKISAKFFMRGWGKITVQKQTKSTK